LENKNGNDAGGVPDIIQRKKKKKEKRKKKRKTASAGRPGFPRDFWTSEMVVFFGLKKGERKKERSMKTVYP